MTFGEPDDVPGQCNARLHIGDNFGDNHATMRCQREPGHEGRHREEYGHGERITVEWEKDHRHDYEEPEPCGTCAQRHECPVDNMMAAWESGECAKRETAP